MSRLGHSRRPQFNLATPDDRNPSESWHYFAVPSIAATHPPRPQQSRKTTMPAMEAYSYSPRRTPWNKGKLIGAKPPPRPKHVWAVSELRV
jgi:hypothetical protein